MLSRNVVALGLSLLLTLQLSAARRKTKEDPQLTALFTRLWKEDVARANVTLLGGSRPLHAPCAGCPSPIVLDLGGRTTPGAKTDAAPKKLFQFVDEAHVFRHATTAALLRLHDDFRVRASTAEDQETNPAEQLEIAAFLDLVIDSPVGRAAYDFLRDDGLLTSFSRAAWKEQLYTIWFQLYSRHRGVLGSSGFEHVFLGEIDDGKVKGVHNWIWVYLQEKAGAIDFQGHLRLPTSNPTLVSGRLTWSFEAHNYSKPMSGFLVGTTPEFDMALLTVCFIKHPNGVSVFKINDKLFKLQTWKNQDGTLGSAYFLD